MHRRQRELDYFRYDDDDWSSSQDSLSSARGSVNVSDSSISTSTTGDTFGDLGRPPPSFRPAHTSSKGTLRSRKTLRPPPPTAQASRHSTAQASRHSHQPLQPQPQAMSAGQSGCRRRLSPSSAEEGRRGTSGSSLGSLPPRHSRLSLTSLDDSAMNSSFGSPKDASSPKEALYATISKRPQPQLGPARAGPTARKRVCFRSEGGMSLSSIQEASPIGPSKPLALSPAHRRHRSGLASPRFALSPGQENEDPLYASLLPPPVPPPLRTIPPSPQPPFKSPARPQPKTNPHFGTPRASGGSISRTAARISLRSRGSSGGSLGRQERVSSYYEDDSASLESWTEGSSSRLQDSRHPGGASAQLQGILRSLKSFGIKGELYLSMVLNRNMLTVTVDEGRNFLGPQGVECNSYVRLSLDPDAEGRTQCRTPLVPRSNAPVFGQTFTLELLRGDRDKHLLISVWNRDLGGSHKALLGCMAFSVRRLLRLGTKPVDGWYFLLSSAYGRHRHLAVEKVNMITYYGSVDSGLQSQDGDGAGASDQPRLIVL